jgi:predicted lipoprotein with Yx(FWY)xxD motif
MSRVLIREVLITLLAFIIITALVACGSPAGSSNPANTTGTVGRPAASPASTAVYSDNIYLTKNDKTKGNYLTDFQGITVYTYDKDTAGVSNCDGDCAKTWRPYTSGATAQSSFPPNISVIVRTDKSKQFAWKGMPLYYYAQDKNPGDIQGDGVEGAWHIVKP